MAVHRTGVPRESSPGSRLIRVAGLALATGGLAIGLVTACSSGSQNPPAAAGRTSSASTAVSATTTAPAAAAMIHISSFKYEVPASVAPGATVSVMNMDGENHTVTADSGKAFDVVAKAGTVATFTAPSTPGSYPFHCTYHSNMHGVLVVK